MQRMALGAGAGAYGDHGPPRARSFTGPSSAQLHALVHPPRGETPEHHAAQPGSDAGMLAGMTSGQRKPAGGGCLQAQ
jgi:hypothetical protein